MYIEHMCDMIRGPYIAKQSISWQGKHPQACILVWCAYCGRTTGWLVKTEKGDCYSVPLCTRQTQQAKNTWHNRVLSVLHEKRNTARHGCSRIMVFTVEERMAG